MSETAIFPSSGQTWRSKTHGATTKIHGRRMRSVIHLSQRDHGYVETPLSDFLLEYEFDACDHSVSCCAIHDEHRTPHVGCVLR